MVNKYILDSNIIIALINQDSLVRAFSRNLKQDVFYVSMITRLEVMMGHSKHSINLEQIEMILDNYPSLPLDEDVCRKATVLQEKSRKTQIQRSNNRCYCNCSQQNPYNFR